MENYDHKEIEKKWQDKWIKENTFETKEDLGKEKFYVLDMFPYPSGDGLHVGHPKGYIATDILSRAARMQGKAVLHPMGWDAFGLPAENYAIKNKIHPRKAVEKNIARFKNQLSLIGLDYDWSREVNTTDPEFYKWTQWIFLKLLEKGLAYESYDPINWCPSCQTGLANEDLEDGKCERCGSVVEKRPMRQWTLKITDYADRLLNDLELLTEWPAHIKESQRNWIGRSDGMIFTAKVKDTNLEIKTFSAHFEAFCADTFVIIAPDHPFLPELIKNTESEKEVLAFARQVVEKRLREGYEGPKEPEGIFTGRFIEDPVGNGELPIWVANYALADYGTGMVKCSAHDERDFDFAKKYNIRLKPVLFPTDPEQRQKVENLEVCFTDMKNGILKEPISFKNKKGGEVREAIIEYLINNKIAERKTTYRLKDWVFSRQRYWGEPIPVIHCDKCGVVPVPYEDLPVKLPEVENYEPTGTGESPLANISDWVNIKCPKCGGEGKRETNTMPQWAGSSWYYLRYTDPKNNDSLADEKNEKYWMKDGGVDVYVGGAEHATRHLIYARFWHKFLYDLGVVSTLEPFKQLHSVGLVLAEDGRKMSKRYGNVVNPDDVVRLYGADSLRLYEMFMGPFENAIAWKTESLIGVRRFLEKVWRISGKTDEKYKDSTSIASALNKTIQKVTSDIRTFKFNTGVSALMILVNALESEEKVAKETFEVLLQLLAPFAPHMTEELWAQLGHDTSIHLSKWPEFDESKIVEEKVTIAVQVNGKVRATFEAEPEIGEEEAKNIALGMAEVQKWIDGKEIKKKIFVKGKLLSIVLG